MVKQRFIIAFAAGAFASFGVWAQAASPVGLWKTIDDQSGKPQSLVRITESNGEFQGKVEKLLRAPDQDQNPTCGKCEDARRNQPVLGMTIITGMKAESSGDYGGGQILDPANGKVYKSKMSLSADGKTLNVRGYIGVPMLGRTQTWVREE